MEAGGRPINSCMCSRFHFNRLNVTDHLLIWRRGWAVQQEVLGYGDEPLEAANLTGKAAKLNGSAWPPICLTSRLTNEAGAALVIAYWPPRLDHDIERQIDLHVEHAGQWFDAHDLPDWLRSQDEQFPPTQDAFRAYMADRHRVSL